ncbi:TPM domain-containing protein [Castellaniella sp. MT123]|uniref:TPM domain-containing protein n=1 Tax=Castellaniella sp. MT123 TaxID=3140381 RepID=UPI0031F45FF9
MDLKRICLHLVTTSWQVKRIFTPPTLRAIETAITQSEKTHAGQIRVAVEGALNSAALLRGQTANERAIEVFSLLRVWDTEHNNGVLIYVLLADRAVEIVADRGIHVKVGTQEWAKICRSMEVTFGQGRYLQGVEAGVLAVTHCLAKHFPAGDGESLGELPDSPVLL